MARFDAQEQLSRELLDQLYNDQRLTIAEIAEQLGCGETTVARALRQHGFPRRSKTDYRQEFSRDDLERLYCGEGLAEFEIAELFGCSQITISRRLRELNIPTRPRWHEAAYTVPVSLLSRWSPELAYIVGLIATDGYLAKGKVEVDFTSADEELIELYCDILHLEGIHVVTANHPPRKAWQAVKLSDGVFRAFLEDVGLTPAKSKTLSPLQVPDEVFADFLRGALDGDGSWYVSRQWAGRYQYLKVELCSASRQFLEWIYQKIEQLADLHGNFRARFLGRSYDLSFVGQKALALGRWVYYSPTVPALSRKRQVWEQMQSIEDSRSTQ